MSEAVGRGGYGAQRALNELKAIFSCQWENGMLPQIRFMPGSEAYRPGPADWGVTRAISGPTALRTSGITQPPVMGLCANGVYLKLGERERAIYRADFLEIAEGLERYHRWLLTERDPWGEHLALCLHPWETGTDNSPAFDPLIETTREYIEANTIPVDTYGRADTVHVKGEHRPTDRDYFAYFGLLSLFKDCAYEQRMIIERSPFLLQDVLFNCLLVASLRGLAELQDALASGGDSNKVREQAEANRAQAEATAAAIRNKLWAPDDGFFYSYDSRGRGLLRNPTVSGLMPLMSSIATEEQARQLVERIGDPAQFGTETPLPSTSAASPSFNPVRYWSGPAWPVTNWLVVRGLRERSSSLAEVLALHTLDMIAEGAERDRARRLAAGVLELNSYGDEFTMPSKKQYAHAWLWDSAIVALSWPLVSEKGEPYREQEGDPRFWEYYHPRTAEPLGAPLMSWTASLYLELASMLNSSH